MRHATQNLGLICHTGAFCYFFVAKIVKSQKIFVLGAKHDGACPLQRNRAVNHPVY